MSFLDDAFSAAGNFISGAAKAFSDPLTDAAIGFVGGPIALTGMALAGGALGLSSAADLVNAEGSKLSSGDKDYLGNLDPVKANVLLTNWLTAGAAPKPIDPADIFGPAQALAPVQAKVAAGQGIAGLFGFGKVIGQLQATAPVPGQTPLAPGVPYSAKPISPTPVGGGGTRPAAP